MIGHQTVIARFQPGEQRGRDGGEAGAHDETTRAALDRLVQAKRAWVR